MRPQEAERRAKQGAGDKGEKNEKGGKGDIGDEGSLTPEEKLARNITSGASAYCRFFAKVTPAKLMPGQSGTMTILATLQGHAVIPSPAPLEMLGQPQQGAISVGALQAQPADAGKLEKGYLGRPVYENYAVFELPVTMAANAPLGSKHTVAVDMKFDLYDGGSTQVIGRFLDRVATEIEVGRTLDPEVKVPLRQAPAPEAAKPEVVAKPPAAAKDAGESAPLKANVVIPEPVAAAKSHAPEVQPATNSVLPVEDEGAGLPVPLLVGGGVLLLGVVLLLARKK